MHLLYCDETNLEERAGDFLLYGGLMIEGARAGELSAAIDAIRVRHGVPRSYLLKFNPGPSKFSHQRFIDLKQDVLIASRDHGAKLLIYAVLHDIARSPDEARRNGISTVCYHFHCALNSIKGAPGLVLVDRFNDEGNLIDQHLRDKFTVGLTGMPYGGGEMRLPNIVGFHYSAVGQSHFPSILDVAVGSLRFAVNARTRGQEQHMATACELLKLLSPMFWRAAATGPVTELGFMFSPKVIKAAKYREKYQSLKDFLAECGIVTTQEITDQRQY
jgi:hypothetical protein